MNRRLGTFLIAAALALVVIVALPGRRSDAPAPLATAFPSVDRPGVPDASATEPVRAAVAGPFADPGELALSLARQRQEERAAELGWERDPFTRTLELARAEAVARDPVAPPEVPGEGRDVLPRLWLRGLSRVDDSWMALIDREIVGPGATLATGHEVVAIDERGAVLRHRGEEFVLGVGAER